MAHTTQRAHELVVSPNRMFAAADTLLEAILSPDGFESRVSMYVGPRLTGEPLPQSMFTPEELLEAMTLLVRMGFVSADLSSRRVGVPCGKGARGEPCAKRSNIHAAH